MDACRRLYGADLVSLAIFGSWAREVATQASDVDVLVVAEPLPPSRLKRVRQFEQIEKETLPARRSMWPQDVPAPEISPVLKTPEEVRAGSPLFLDMTQWCDILYDRDRFFEEFIDELRARLERNGARRVQSKGGYYWEYKPNIRPNEVVEL